MPNVRGSKGSHQGGYQTRDQIEKTHMRDKARDDLKGAYAGKENDGPFDDPKMEHEHSTNVKARVTEGSKLRTPER